MAQDQNNDALYNINKSLIAHDATQDLPQITLADGSKIQTGTVGALMQNMKSYDRICSGEEVKGLTKESLEHMMTVPIPTIKKAGLFDFFPPDEWITGKSPARTFVGKKAKEMGY